MTDSPPISGPAAGPAPTSLLRPLNIGMVATPWYSVPPARYGGTESVVAGLVDGLVDRGHRVTLLGAGRPGTKAQHFIPVYDVPPSDELGSSSIPEVILAAEVSRQFGKLDLDVVHDNSLAGPILASSRSVPTVVTMHGPTTTSHADYLQRLGDSIHVVAISDNQRSAAPRVNWVGRVYNAIDVDAYPYRTDKDDVLLWVGRYCPEKAPDLAIDAARAVGKPLILAGKRTDRAEQEYFRTVIEPRLGPDIECLGELEPEDKRALFARCACLVFPIQWEEPFGIVMVEAMACGTPVVATRRGSAPEIVDDGATGILVDLPGELPGAVLAAMSLDPLACRKRARTLFDLPVMADHYEHVYRGLVSSAVSTRVG